MIYRSFNVPLFSSIAEDLLLEGSVGFDAEELIMNKHNLLLTDGHDNFSLFEYTDKGVYYGHYFFKSAKGKQAIQLAKEMLNSIKDFDNNAKSVVGAIPVENRKAIWITRKLGFDYCSTLETSVGTMELYTLGLDTHE